MKAHNQVIRFYNTVEGKHVGAILGESGIRSVDGSPCVRQVSPTGQFYKNWQDYHYEFWLDGLRHREDGPAYSNGAGHVEYWVRGQRHRKGGPAIINSNSLETVKQWWEDGKFIRSESVLKTSESIKQIWREMGFNEEECESFYTSVETTFAKYEAANDSFEIGVPF